jgi:hypothetical protein
MKRVWKNLIEDYEDSDHVLIADVDCTSEAGRPLCKRYNVDGYPTLKYGDPSNLEEYEGERDYDSLKSLVMDELEPSCSPDFLHLCNRDQKLLIQDYMGMEYKDLDELIEVAMAEILDIEERYEEQIEELQEEARRLEEVKDNVVDAEAPVLQLLRDVQTLRRIQEKNAQPDNGEK